MALRFVFVFEAIVAVLTCVLFFHFVDAINFTLDSRDTDARVSFVVTYCSSS